MVNLMHRFLSVSLVFIILAVTLSGQTAQAQISDYQYFDETGHAVRGEFLLHYRAVPDPLLLYGYPITDEITSQDGLTVQYFQRARFEHHPEFPAGQRVTLTPLGRKTYQAGNAISVQNAGCRTYPPGIFSICFAFLEFFDKHGGLQQFGYPISAFELQNNIIVQYFDNARMEWQPGKAEGQRVVLTDLGRIYFSVAGEDPSLLNSTPPPEGNIHQVTALRASVFPWKAVTLSSDSQRIFVIVHDQTNQAVPNAEVLAIIHWPSGAQSLTGVRTDTNGVSILLLEFQNQPYGQLISVDIRVNYLGVDRSTVTSFRIWY